MANNVFTISGLSFAYGQKRIFEGLDLAFAEGVVTTLIGANGSGKSTLFNLMTKNLKPSAGRSRRLSPEICRRHYWLP